MSLKRYFVGDSIILSICGINLWKIIGDRMLTNYFKDMGNERKITFFSKNYFIEKIQLMLIGPQDIGLRSREIEGTHKDRSENRVK